MLEYIKGQKSVLEEIDKLFVERRTLLEAAIEDPDCTDEIVELCRAEFSTLMELKRRLARRGIRC